MGLLPQPVSTPVAISDHAEIVETAVVDGYVACLAGKAETGVVSFEGSSRTKTQALSAMQGNSPWGRKPEPATRSAVSGSSI